MRRTLIGLFLAVAAVGTFAFGAAAFSGTAEPAEAATTAPLPGKWPSNTLQIGVAEGPGESIASPEMGFRYQYLAGGVNTGGGWANWNANGGFVTSYIQSSTQQVPVFSYYMIRQSAPGNGMGEGDGVRANLSNNATMRAYLDDLKLFFQRAGATGRPVVLHVEPDMWGYIQQWAPNDDASRVAVSVASSGQPDVARFPNTGAGLAQAIVHLRDQYAPNVVLGYALSVWGTGNDIVYSNPSNATVDALASRAATFYRSLGANFDVTFTEFTDRDAGFKQYQYGDGGASWWDAADFERNARFLERYSSESNTRLVMWQIPQGNTKMRAMNNTWNHYQDNKVEWLLDDSSRRNLQRYVDAGVIAFLFGRGADGATCSCDANRDGVTNPAPINGNNRESLSSDDDGGYFDERVAAYYATGAMRLTGGSTPPPTATPTSTPPRTSTPAPTNTPAPQPTATPTRDVPAPGGWQTSANVSSSSVSRGQTLNIDASAVTGRATTALVNLEIYDAQGNKVFQNFWSGIGFSSNQAQSASLSWRVPASAAPGTYTVKIGVFQPGWSGLLHWNDSAATFTVR